jgi:glycosyltransferase involved in cell wall biosynthesis
MTRRKAAASWQAANWRGYTWAEILSSSPLIIHALTSIGFPLGAASALGPRFRHRHATFLVMPSSTLEDPGATDYLGRTASAYLSAHPLHHIAFACNTHEQTEAMRATGHQAFTANQNCFMNDDVFKPLSGVEPVYDAVYNARLSPEKRHELAGELKTLALIYFYDSSVGPPAVFHAIRDRYVTMLPNATFLNRVTSSGCDWMMGDAINRVLAQSRVGLCLSRSEGAMRVSIEYLLAGLPIVATPSAGGREYFFDDEYCAIVDPDPRKIREAADGLIARAIPRDYIRAKTLRRVEAERLRYIRIVQDMIDSAGGGEEFEPRFWRITRGESIVRWRSMAEFYAEISRELRLTKAAKVG